MLTRMRFVFAAIPIIALTTFDSAAQDLGPVCRLNAYFNSITKDVSNEDFIWEARSKCHPGDIVLYPAKMVYVINKTCDFGKTIYVNGTSASCVFVGIREDRK